MKKAFLSFGTLLLISLMLFSCKKTYTCTCDTVNDNTGLVVSTRTKEIVARIKDNADTECSMNERRFAAGVDSTEYCNLSY